MVADGVPATNSTYGVFIDVFGRAGLVEEAVLWLRHMIRRGIPPDEVSMNTAVRVLKDAGELALGEKLFQDWCSGSVCVESLIAALRGRQSKGETILSPKQFLLSEMLRYGGMPPVGAVSEEPPRPQRPRLAATFNTLIDLYGKWGRLEEASKVFGEMMQSGVAPDTITFNTMINVCGSRGLMEEAKALLEKMEERRIRPDVKTFNIFMSMHAASGDMAAMLSYFQRLTASGLRPDAVSQRIVLSALCKSATMALEADTVIRELVGNGELLDEQVLPVVMKMYVERGMLEQAAEFLAQQLCSSSSFSAPPVRSSRQVSSKIYAAIADVYAEKGLWMDAETVFSANMPRCRDLVEYNVMIKAYGRGKEYDRSLQLFDEMPSRGIWPDACSYNSIIQMLATADQPERASKLLRKMKADENSRNLPKMETFSAVIASCGRVGLPKLACEMFDEMRSTGITPNEVAYGALINALASAREEGCVTEARRRLEEMESARIDPNCVVLTSMMKAYKRIGNWEEAQKLYSRIASSSGGSDSAAGNCILGLYADLGMVAEARSVFLDLCSRGIANTASYGAMVRVYTNMGMVEDAAALAEELLAVDSSAFTLVVAAFSAAGRLKDCGALLLKMLRRGELPDQSMFGSLFGIIKRAGVPAEVAAQLEAAAAGREELVAAAITTVALAAAGLEREAVEYAEKLVGEGGTKLSLFAWNAAMWAFGAGGEIDKVMMLSMRMKDVGIVGDTVTCMGLARCYGKAGYVEGVNRIYGMVKCGEMEASESLVEAVMAAYVDVGRGDLAEVAGREMRFCIQEREIRE